jgi:hypothetical protein
MPEIWKDVAGREGAYSISDAGRLRYEQDRPSNRCAVHAWDMVAQSRDANGYLFAQLSRAGDRANRRNVRNHLFGLFRAASFFSSSSSIKESASMSPIGMFMMQS